MTSLKKKRTELKIKQVELARRLGIKPSSVCEKEKSGIWSLKTAAKYAKALKCKPFDLLEFIGN